MLRVPLVQGLFERVQDEAGVRRAADTPADNAPGISIVRPGGSHAITAPIGSPGYTIQRISRTGSAGTIPRSVDRVHPPVRSGDGAQQSIRTPLSAIIGYSEMTQEDIVEGVSPDDMRVDLCKVEGNARHLSGLINDVLDLAKVESGKMEVYAETFDAAAMARDVASSVEGLVAKKGNTLALDLGEDLGSMHSDVTKVRQILLNLLSNAAKFTQAGTITLSATRIVSAGPDQWVAFRVADTGIGMTEDQLGRLFLRFS